MLGTIIACLLGLVLAAGGAFVTFAAGMSAVPDDRLGSRGCIASLVGLVIIILALVRAAL